MSEEVRVVLRVDHRVNDPEKNCLAVLGSAHELGCWKPEKAVKAEYMGRSTWQAVVKLPANQTSMWKWVVLDRTKNEIIQWESGIDKMIEIREHPLMGVSEWGKPVVISDISTESNTRIFEGVRNITSENAKTQDMPRNSLSERRGRVSGKKLKRVNSGEKLSEGIVIKTKSKKSHRSPNTTAKHTEDPSEFAGKCKSTTTNCASTGNKSSNAENTAKVKSSKGLKGLFQKVLRTQSPKSTAQEKSSSKDKSIKSESEKSPITTQVNCIKEKQPNSETAASAARVESMSCRPANNQELEILKGEDINQSPTLSKTLKDNEDEFIKKLQVLESAESNQLNLKPPNIPITVPKSTPVDDSGLSSMEEFKICQSTPQQPLQETVKDNVVETLQETVKDNVVETQSELSINDNEYRSRCHFEEQKCERENSNTMLFNNKKDKEENFQKNENNKCCAATCPDPSTRADSIASLVGNKDNYVESGPGNQIAELKEEIETTNFEEINDDELQDSLGTKVSSPENTTTLIEVYKAKYGDEPNSLTELQMFPEDIIETLNSKHMPLVENNTEVFNNADDATFNDCSTLNIQNKEWSINEAENECLPIVIDMRSEISGNSSKTEIHIDTSDASSNHLDLDFKMIDYGTLAPKSDKYPSDGSINSNTGQITLQEEVSVLKNAHRSENNETEQAKASEDDLDVTNNFVTIEKLSDKDGKGEKTLRQITLHEEVSVVTNAYRSENNETEQAKASEDDFDVTNNFVTTEKLSDKDGKEEKILRQIILHDEVSFVTNACRSENNKTGQSKASEVDFDVTNNLVTTEKLSDKDGKGEKILCQITLHEEVSDVTNVRHSKNNETEQGKASEDDFDVTNNFVTTATLSDEAGKGENILRQITLHEEVSDATNVHLSENNETEQAEASKNNLNATDSFVTTERLSDKDCKEEKILRQITLHEDVSDITNTHLSEKNEIEQAKGSENDFNIADNFVTSEILSDRDGQGGKLLHPEMLPSSESRMITDKERFQLSASKSDSSGQEKIAFIDIYEEKKTNKFSKSFSDQGINCMNIRKGCVIDNEGQTFKQSVMNSFSQKAFQLPDIRIEDADIAERNSFNDPPVEKSGYTEVSKEPSSERSKCKSIDYCAENKTSEIINKVKTLPKPLPKPRKKDISKKTCIYDNSIPELLHHGLTETPHTMKDFPLNVTPVPVAEEDTNYNKESDQVQMTVNGDNNDHKSTDAHNKNTSIDVTLQMCKQMKLVTKHLQEQSKYEEEENNPDLSKQTTFSPGRLQNKSMSTNRSPVRKTPVNTQPQSDGTVSIADDADLKQKPLDNNESTNWVIDLPVEGGDTELSKAALIPKENNISVPLNGSFCPAEKAISSADYLPNISSVQNQSSGSINESLDNPMQLTHFVNNEKTDVAKDSSSEDEDACECHEDLNPEDNIVQPQSIDGGCLAKTKNPSADYAACQNPEHGIANQRNEVSTDSASEENESRRDNGLAEFAGLPFKSVSNSSQTYNQDCSIASDGEIVSKDIELLNENEGAIVSTDTAPKESETLKEYGLHDLVCFPIENISDFAQMQTLNKAINCDGKVTSKATELRGDIVENLNNLSRCAGFGTMPLKSTYEKNIDIEKVCPVSSELLMGENSLIDRNTECIEKTPPVNFNHQDVNFIRCTEKVPNTSSKPQQTHVSSNKETFFDVVDKYKVPIGMSIAAACAAIFIVKKH